MLVMSLDHVEDHLHEILDILKNALIFSCQYRGKLKKDLIIDNIILRVSNYKSYKYQPIHLFFFQLEAKSNLKNMSIFFYIN